jgi:hypothetical protein
MSEEPPESEVDPDFPFRSRWGFLSGFVVFVGLNILVYITTSRISLALLAAFGLWLLAELLKRLLRR